MVKGVGVDACEISRIEKALKRKHFKYSIYTDNEIKNEHGNVNEYYAGRFACKEAVFKALSGLMRIDLRTIETLSLENGAPVVTITDQMKRAGVNIINISITTEVNMAIAFCIIE
ncbi:holo-ACP synthase [Ruminococcus sp. OA3]|uniref:holo-ACP synthase n=1 Tax=Ruminococcus sp. OA3 TaxID=2914164 RepID=UPI001F06CC3A|nr:holo-ACP synthase [Ruminococcus sp. OA3]MCH1982920.1 holo-ACP synthase [Ruminococcus sp. OA3]